MFRWRGPGKDTKPREAYHQIWDPYTRVWTFRLLEKTLELDRYDYGGLTKLRHKFEPSCIFPLGCFYPSNFEKRVDITVI